MTDNHTPNHDPSHGLPLETAAFMNAGLGVVAYAKPVTIEDGSTAVAVMAANGTQVALAQDLAHADAFIVQQDWDRLSLH